MKPEDTLPLLVLAFVLWLSIPVLLLILVLTLRRIELTMHDELRWFKSRLGPGPAGDEAPANEHPPLVPRGAISFTCTACGERITIKDRLGATLKWVQCPKCKQRLRPPTRRDERG